MNNQSGMNHHHSWEDYINLNQWEIFEEKRNWHAKYFSSTGPK